MKKLLFVSLLATGFNGWAQLPYFQREYNSSTTGYTYAAPVDIHYDGSGKVFSYHKDIGTNGTIVVKYDATTGALLNVVSISRTGAIYTPVRVRNQGAIYYVMFNQVISGQNRYCIVGLNTTTNAVTFNRTIAPLGSATLDLTGVDFTFDGSGSIYALSNRYDAVNDQTDLCITKINIATQTATWNNVYTNVARSESGANIIYRSASEIFVSGISYDLNNILFDRGPILLQVNSAGAYVNSSLYKYTNCSSVRPAATWVANSAGTLYLTSISYVGADGNGPVWIAKIDPTTLAITAQENFGTHPSYLNPEIQEVTSSTGTKLLMSGSASQSNTLNPGYTHYYFDAATLAFSSGKLYNTMSSSAFSGDIYDTYITGTDRNVFSVARNPTTSTNYYFLKTSTLGINNCDDDIDLEESTCEMGLYEFTIFMTSPEVTLPLVKPVVTSISNDYDESCGIYCSDCALTIYESLTEEAAAPGDKMMELPGVAGAPVMVYPNPATSQVTVDVSGLQVSQIRLLGVDGKLIRTMEINTNKVDIDLTGLEKGVYLLQLKGRGEQKVIRLIKE